MKTEYESTSGGLVSKLVPEPVIDYKYLPIQMKVVKVKPNKGLTLGSYKTKKK